MNNFRQWYRILPVALLALWPGATAVASADTGSPPEPVVTSAQEPRPILRRSTPSRDQVDRQRRAGETEQRSWPSELVLSQIQPRLKQFFGALQGGGFSRGQTESMFAPDFRGARLELADGAQVERTGIRLSTWKSGGGDLPRDEFAAAWTHYAEGFSTVFRTEFHVTRLSLAPAEAESATKNTAASAARSAAESNVQGAAESAAENAVKASRVRMTVEFRITGAEADLRREDQGSLEAVFVPLAGRPGVWLWEHLALRELHTLRAEPQFSDVAGALGDRGDHPLDTLIVSYFSEGVSLADVDADGDLDLFMPHRYGPAVLYENDGQGRFTDMTDRVGLGGLVAARSGYFFDWDNDGDLDLLVLTGERMHAFERRGESYVDVSRVSGFQYMRTTGLTGAAIADYDGDGLLDFHVANYGDPGMGPGYGYFDSRRGFFNKLFRNEGGGRFSDQTEPAGMDADNRRWTFASIWIDHNGDFAPDLYVVNDYGPNQLFENLGKGRFRDVAPELGAEDFGNGMAASWADYDNDGKQDLFVSNMRSYAGERIAHSEDFPGDAAARAKLERFAKGNTLLRNTGNGGFEEVESWAPLDAKWAWGNVFFDYDNDGDLDLYVANGMFSNLRAVENDPVFWRHVLVPISLGAPGVDEGAALLGDLLQMRAQSFGGHERNRLFQNLGDGRFVDVAAVVGADIVLDSRAVAAGDLDGDGALDLVISNRNSPQLSILHNRSGNPGRFLAVDLVGTRSNRQGVGARLSLLCGDLTQVRTVQLGSGYVSQSPSTAWFGLGDCERVDSLEVRWPSGQRQVFSDLTADRAITVTEGVQTLAEAP
jgi:hypothetical protein